MAQALQITQSTQSARWPWGVHEHWLMTMIRPLAIRTVLVMNSLLFPVKAGVVQLRVGDDLFR